MGAAAELLEVLLARGQDVPTPAASPSQLRALRVVEGAEGINLRTLGSVLGSRPPSVTRLCDRLEAIGLLTRTPSSTSRREVELRLTASGRALLDEHRAIRAREMSEVLGRMEAGEVQALVRGLIGFRREAEDVLATGLPAGLPAGEDTAVPDDRAAGGAEGGAQRDTGRGAGPVFGSA
ncbi:MarR family winged helix-turn-helix transcriptional regulator [Streptomyces sp. NPDC058646]|uniref:MarR family winged helix-turn-helix transcriptional regulator n=1 Tax=Streptomyces sp. NPDC058646 TaxID=3346574 RepID=UPI003651DED2